jgi:hypothetical protein
LGHLGGGLYWAVNMDNTPPSRTFQEVASCMQDHSLDEDKAAKSVAGVNILAVGAFGEMREGGQTEKWAETYSFPAAVSCEHVRSDAIPWCP